MVSVISTLTVCLTDTDLNNMPPSVAWLTVLALKEHPQPVLPIYLVSLQSCLLDSSSVLRMSTLIKRVPVTKAFKPKPI